MSGVESVVRAKSAIAYVCAYLEGKGRRTGGTEDVEVDQAVHAGMEQLHTLVVHALGAGPTLDMAGEQAAANGKVGEPTRALLVDALAEAIEDDSGFARTLAEALVTVQAAEATGATPVPRSGEGIAISGNVDIEAEGGSTAALRVT